MNRRKGVLPLLLIVLFMSVVSMTGVLTVYMTHGEGMALSYGNGLAAVYAAESGANWGLEAVRGGVRDYRHVVISDEGSRSEISLVFKEGGKGEIHSVGTHEESGVRRYVNVYFTIHGEGTDGAVTVESADSYRWTS